MDGYTVLDDKGRVVAKQIIYKKELLESLGVNTSNSKVPEDEQELYKYHVLEQLNSNGVKLILFNEYLLGDLGKITAYAVLRIKHGGDYINFIFYDESQLRKLRNAIERAIYYIRKANKSRRESISFQNRIDIYKSLPGETMRSINLKQVSGNSDFEKPAGNSRKRKKKANP